MMEKFLDIKDFKDDLEKKNYKKIYQEIVEYSYLLADKVAKKRGIFLSERNDDDIENFHSIIFSFKRATVYFDDVIFLMEYLSKWDAIDDDPFEKYKDKKIEKYIKFYNNIVSKLNYYEKIEKVIKKKGYNSAKQELEKKFIEAFKEMLTAKGKDYNENWSLSEWFENVSPYYEYYSYDLKELAEEVYGRGILVSLYDDYELIEANEVERLADMNKLYEEMLSYKKQILEK